MASHILCALCGLIIASVANLNGVNGQKEVTNSSPGGPPSCSCNSLEFWSADIDECVSCSTCIKYPKTPSCNTCNVPPVERTDDVWRMAAIFSFSVLAVVLVIAILIIGVMLHQRNTKRRPLREPIEETTGPLYQV